MYTNRHHFNPRRIKHTNTFTHKQTRDCVMRNAACSFSDCMNGDDVALQVVLVGGDVVAQVTGEAAPLVDRLHVHP